MPRISRSRARAIMITLGAAIVAAICIYIILQWRQDNLNRTLIEAIKSGDDPQAIALLDEGADANAVDTPSKSAQNLMQVALETWDKLRGVHKAVAWRPTAWILASTHPDRFGNPFDFRVRNIDPALLRAFLRHNADVNATDIGLGITVLDSQIIAGNAQNVAVLLQHGAVVNRAAARNSLQWAAIANQPEIAEMLLNRGAVEATGPGEKTALHYAAEVGDGSLRMLKLLVEHHADLSAQDANGWTPLMWGLQSDPAITKYLLKSGSNPSMKNVRRMTALDIAMQSRDSEHRRAIVGLLSRAMAHARSHGRSD